MSQRFVTLMILLGLCSLLLAAQHTAANEPLTVGAAQPVGEQRLFLPLLALPPLTMAIPSVLGPEDPDISADGRFIAFSSHYPLVPDDTNVVCFDGRGDTNCSDVFVYDRWTRQIERVSVGSDGTQGDDDSGGPSISSDGRFVAFTSLATNLVPNLPKQVCFPNSNCAQAYVHDRKTGQTELVSVSSSGVVANNDLYSRGVEGASLSADGRYVAFTTTSPNLVPNDTNEESDVFVHDRVTKQTKRISVASSGTESNGLSTAASISGDGNSVVFVSAASNLVENDTNTFCTDPGLRTPQSCMDVFVHDLRTNRTTSVSIASDGSAGDGPSSAGYNDNQPIAPPSISFTGRYVAFTSRATNLAPNDTNGVADVFVRDQERQQTTRVSVSSTGTQANDRSAWGL